jgi:phosphate transport system permease protein
MSPVDASAGPDAGPAPRARETLYEPTPLMVRRKRAEKRFQAYGVVAILLGVTFLALLMVSIVSRGYPAFQQTYVTLEMDLDAEVVDPEGGGTAESIMGGNRLRWTGIVREAMAERLGVDPDDRAAAAPAYALLSRGAAVQLRDMLAANPDLIGQTVDVRFIADGNVDAFLKGTISEETPEARRQISDQQIAWARQLREEGALEKGFNWGLFTFGASSRPETAGLGVALIGSAYMMLIVLVVALPIGVAAAIYLEQFAPKNRITDVIEVNISNLAAVPSIVFGILGLAVFINYIGLPRSAPIVGGLVLSLMTLPTVIIASRAAIRAVPPSIREAALGVGASKTQTVFHHVLPLAMPGILTGTILGLAQALGETAPLLMIGMVAFVADYPGGVTDPATALPVQIFMWSNSAERAFVERTSAAIIVLLLFMLTMNVIAIILRRRFERRW